MEGAHRSIYTEVDEQFSRFARVLGINMVALLKDAYGTQGHILQVANRGWHYIQFHRNGLGVAAFNQRAKVAHDSRPGTPLVFAFQCLQLLHGFVA